MSDTFDHELDAYEQAEAGYHDGCPSYSPRRCWNGRGHGYPSTSPTPMHKLSFVRKLAETAKGVLLLLYKDRATKVWIAKSKSTFDYENKTVDMPMWFFERLAKFDDYPDAGAIMYPTENINEKNNEKLEEEIEKILTAYAEHKDELSRFMAIDERHFEAITKELAELFNKMKGK